MGGKKTEIIFVVFIRYNILDLQQSIAEAYFLRDLVPNRERSVCLGDFLTATVCLDKDSYNYLVSSRLVLSSYT